MKIKTKAGQRKVVVEFDADKFEKVAAAFGFFGSDFLSSLENAEKDIKAGRVRKIQSLKNSETRTFSKNKSISSITPYRKAQTQE